MTLHEILTVQGVYIFVVLEHVISIRQTTSMESHGIVTYEIQMDNSLLFHTHTDITSSFSIVGHR